MTRSRRAHVNFQPSLHQGFLRGVRRLAGTIEPTLGPGTGTVVVEAIGNRPPEILDDGGQIARRMLQLPEPHEDLGAMFLRGLLWRVHELAGDGTATTCVIFRQAFERGLRHLRAGTNATLLRRALLDGLASTLDDLARQAVPVTDGEQLRTFARTLVPDPAVADALSDVIDVLGPHAKIEVRPGGDGSVTVEMLDGNYWEGPALTTGIFSATLRQRIELPACPVLVSNLDLDDPGGVRPMLEAARAEGAAGLLIIANSLSDRCLTYLLANRTATFEPIAARTPGVSVQDRILFMRDIEALTGARAFHASTRQPLGAVGPAAFGQTRRAWLDRTHFGIAGGGGDPRGLIDHVRSLTGAWERSGNSDDAMAFSQRIGTLTGAAAMIRVGATDRPATERRMEYASRLVSALKGVLTDGLVPGGGLALGAAGARLAQSRPEPASPAELAAFDILAHALNAPRRKIVANAGGPMLTGPADSAKTTRLAARIAIEGAAQALTIAAAVHRRSPEEAMTP